MLKHICFVIQIKVICH